MKFDGCRGSFDLELYKSSDFTWFSVQKLHSFQEINFNMQNIKEILKIICALYVFFLCLQVFCTHTVMHKFRLRVEFQIYAIELEHHALTHVICRENIISSKKINIEVHISKQMKYLESKMNYFKVHNLLCFVANL